MNEVTDIVACPVCGTQVSLTDTHCPKCNAEFAPGVMDEPLDAAVAAKHRERKAARSGLMTKGGMVPSMQVTILAVTYAVGYASVIAANYISSGGIINQQYEQLLIMAGALTLAAAIVSAFFVGRLGNIQSTRISFALIATFLLLIPPLLIIFKW